jgi:PAS domain S-box-containing protein
MKVKTTRKNIFLLSLPTFVVIFIVATLFWFFDRMQEAGNMRAQVHTTLTSSQTILTMLIDAETATRGYLLTDDEAYLAPYQAVRDSISTKIKQLRAVTHEPDAQAQLNKIAPLITARLDRLMAAIALKRSNNLPTVIESMPKGEGKKLMDSIRAEMAQYNKLQQARLEYHEKQYQMNMTYLFAFIVSASIFMLLFAQVFAYGIYRTIHQRLMNYVHEQTKLSLDKQEAMNQQLNLAYVTVQDSERKLEVTLNSIADAVIATDREARVTLMNRVAELLTGWTQQEALGRPIPEIFKIINKETRQPMAVPVIETLLYGAAQGSNDTVLVLRDGNQCTVANSCAPIRDHDGQVIGAVLVFRDITAENAAQQALLDSTELVKTILGTVVDGIVTFNAQSNLIETVNPAAEKMFGYSAAELIGKRFSTIVPELNEDNGSLEYYNPSEEDSANGVIREVTGQFKNGTTFPMEITVSEMLLGGQRFFTGVLRNITARKHAEAVMRESEYRYRNLFDTIDEGFCVAEMIYKDGILVDQLFLETNPSFSKQSGLQNAQSRFMRELVPDIEAEWFRFYDKVLRTGEPARFEYEVKALQRWLDIYTCRLGDAGSCKMAILFTDVTDRKRSEQALRESDERVRLATEATGVGIWEWNIADDYMRWDAQMFRIYGVTPTPDGRVKRDEWLHHLLPEDRSTQKALDKTLSQRDRSSREFRFQRSGEHETRYIQSVETLRTNSLGQVESIVGTNLDITELKRAEDTLRDSERHLRAVIDALPVAIYTTDANGSLTHFNQTAVEFSGRVPQLGTDQWCISMKLFNPDGSPLPHDHCPMAIALKEGRQLLGAEAIAERPDGSRVWFTAHPTPLHDTSGKLIGGINMLIDITERKRLDQVLLENNVEMKKAKNLAEKANQAKSDFLSNMSHELRTPLSAILGFAQLLEASNPPPTPNQKRSVDQILQAGWYLLDLINEILDLSLIESGRLPVEMEAVSLAELIRECETMIEPQASNRNISLHFPTFNSPMLVNADTTRLKQAIINLLSNAIKYNRPSGSVTLSCYECEANRIRISVEDTGEGLSPEKISQLFQPFNRLGKETSSVEGTGIGLVMTKRLVKLMGGKIHVKSTVGKGTIFSIDLDMAQSHIIEHDPQHQPNVIPISAPTKNNGTKRTLLYVEDNPANLTLIEDVIAERPDIVLITARDGYSGIELARVTQPDIILMDINLPGISGTEALKILAKDPITNHITVIALSANAIPQDIEKGLQAGFFRYLTKPIKINEFMSALDSAFEFSYQKSMRINEEKRT